MASVFLHLDQAHIVEDSSHSIERENETFKIITTFRRTDVKSCIWRGTRRLFSYRM